MNILLYVYILPTIYTLILIPATFYLFGEKPAKFSRYDIILYLIMVFLPGVNLAFGAMFTFRFLDGMLDQPKVRKWLDGTILTMNDKE